MKQRKSKGGNMPLPLRFFDVHADQPSAAAGHDLLQASGLGVRPKIGGKSIKRSNHNKRTLRTLRRLKKRNNKTKGGFVPSVMEGFVAATSKYIVPLALFAGYKLMEKTKKNSKRSRK